MPTHKPAARGPLSAVPRQSRPRRPAFKSNTLAVPDPSASSDAARLVVKPAMARRWAQADASALARMRSAQFRRNAMETIAGHMRASPAYAAALARHAPALAADGKAITDEWLALRATALQGLQRELARVTRMKHPNPLTAER